MWLNDPQNQGETKTIPLLRPRSGQKIEATLTGKPMRCFVHYAAGRSWPCTDHKCELCKKEIPRRCYAYYPVTGKQDNVGILELTSLAESSLISQMEEYSDVPCGKVTVSRPAGRRNMPCNVHWEEPENYKERTSGGLTQSRLQEALLRIWKLPIMNGEIDEKEYLEKLNEAIRLRTTKSQTH